MTRLATTPGAIVLGFLLCGCAANPLVGRWTAATPSGAYTLATTLAFADDNTMTVTDAGTGTCSGSRMYSGLRWSSSQASAAMTVTFSGGATCSGMIVCTSMGSTVNIGCPTDTSQMTGACGYSLSQDMNALTLSNCSGSTGSSTTYTRAVR